MKLLGFIVGVAMATVGMVNVCQEGAGNWQVVGGFIATIVGVQVAILAIIARPSSDPRWRPCQGTACFADAIGCCDHCDKYFCGDCGRVGGDRETEGGLVAYPSTCNACQERHERELGVRA